MNEVVVKIESHEKAGLFVRVNRAFTAELREYLNECRFPFAVNADKFKYLQRMEEQDLTLPMRSGEGILGSPSLRLLVRVP